MIDQSQHLLEVVLILVSPLSIKNLKLNKIKFFSSACTSSIVEYLNELGARIEYEYRISGYLFRKGRMKITVAKVFKGITPNKLEPISQSYLVELSVVAPSGQEAIMDDMKAFAEQLKPLVHLDKYDPKRFAAGALP